MKRQPTYNSDIAVIQSKLDSIKEDINGFLTKCERYETRFNNIEVSQATMKAENSTMAKLQAVLAVVLSTIAAYLGVAIK